MADRNSLFVAAAYIVTWVVILGYATYTHRALRRARAAYHRAMAQRPTGGT
jgi:hypothetical protein